MNADAAAAKGEELEAMIESVIQKRTSTLLRRVKGWKGKKN